MQFCALRELSFLMLDIGWKIFRDKMKVLRNLSTIFNNVSNSVLKCRRNSFPNNNIATYVIPVGSEANWIWQKGRLKK